MILHHASHTIDLFCALAIEGWVPFPRPQTPRPGRAV